MTRKVVPGESVSDGSISDNQRTIESYELIAREYAEETAARGSEYAGAEGLGRLVEAMPAGGTVLEAGSGPGWDADFVESLGFTVRRTDITDAFIKFQRERGKAIERLDLISDELGGPYDGVMVLWVVQHIERDQMTSVIAKVAKALKTGGAFLVSMREGVGDTWEVGDSGNPYRIVLWEEDAFRSLLADVGLVGDWSSRTGDSEGSAWLTILVRKRDTSDEVEVIDRPAS